MRDFITVCPGLMLTPGVQMPMFIHFAWQPPEDNWFGNTWRARSLLNLEKTVFGTDKQGLPPGNLLLTISREGVHRDGPGEGSTKLLYNIGVVVW